MRPTAPEILRGASQSLTARVLPELDSPWARSQVQQIASLMGLVAAESDGAADRLVRENDALQAFCRRWVDGAVTPESVRASLTESAELPPAEDLRISTLQERNDQLWLAIEPLLQLAARDELDVTLVADLKSTLRLYVDARQPSPRPA